MRTQLLSLWICAIVIIAGCAHKNSTLRERLIINSQENKATSQTNTADIITVWVHGTRTITDHIMHNFFYRPEGMSRAIDIAPQYHMREIADALSHANPTEYALDHIYFFGWSGELNFDARKKAANDLYLAIQLLLVDYKKAHGVTPKIRIITHSHGGNVALNLARIKDENKFAVDELILLACPVQDKTEEYIRDPHFKEIFALYSSFDWLQVIDPQGLYKHKRKSISFSRRRFPDQANLMQVKIRLNKRSLLHVDFIRTQFVAILPSIIDKMRLWHQKSSDGKLSEHETSRILSVNINS